MGSIAQKICSVEECYEKFYAKDYCFRHYRRLRMPCLKSCLIEGCNRLYNANGYCSMHLKRLKVHGDPYYVRQIKISCRIEDCKRISKTDNLCGTHYNRFYKYGDPLYNPPEKSKICCIEDCTKGVKSQEMCAMHYKRFRTHGDPSISYREYHGMIKTSEYKTWGSIKARCKDINDSRYAGRGIRMCKRWSQRFLDFFEDMGKKPIDNKRYSIERVDNNGNYSCGKCGECIANGWPMNCRWATDTEQSHNKRVNRNNTSGVSGVNSHHDKWVSRITVDNIRLFLGIFNNKEDAIKARKDAEKKYWKVSM